MKNKIVEYTECYTSVFSTELNRLHVTRVCNFSFVPGCGSPLKQKSGPLTYTYLDFVYVSRSALYIEKHEITLFEYILLSIFEYRYSLSTYI